VKQAFAQQEIVYLKGDWTNYNAEITALLAQFGRNGVPLYLLYRPNKEVQVLPQILTPTIVLQAIES
jgi:thiol:disulfide interchange protein DsbD